MSALERQLDYEGTLSALQALVGRRVSVLIGTVSAGRAPVALLAGTLEGASDTWEPMQSRAIDEVVTFAVGEGSHFALERATFGHATQDGEDVSIQIADVVIVVTAKREAV